MKHIKIFLIVLSLFALSGCEYKAKKKEIPSNDKTFEALNITGNYVTESYSKRNEGYDWVAVSVHQAKDEQLKVSIRSRADKKQPTCTFDAVAQKINEKTYKTQIEGKTVLFDFSSEQLNISAENEEDEGLLYFYCSGGASIKGTYLKLNEGLDQSQIDQTEYTKVLNLQDVAFNITSIKKEGVNTLTVFTFGLENEYNESFTIEGEFIISAEVEDLNSDGSPELFVFTSSVGSGSYGNVYAFSVNTMKSMSQVYFPPTAENNNINKGYMGHDEFTLVENRLGQRFPIYKEGDTNANPTGGTRQVLYKLVEGEAMRKLEVNQVLEY